MHLGALDQDSRHNCSRADNPRQEGRGNAQIDVGKGLPTLIALSDNNRVHRESETADGPSNGHGVDPPARPSDVNPEEGALRSRPDDKGAVVPRDTQSNRKSRERHDGRPSTAHAACGEQHGYDTQPRVIQPSSLPCTPDIDPNGVESHGPSDPMTTATAPSTAAAVLTRILANSSANVGVSCKLPLSPWPTPLRSIALPRAFCNPTGEEEKPFAGCVGGGVYEPIAALMIKGDRETSVARNPDQTRKEQRRRRGRFRRRQEASQRRLSAHFHPWRSGSRARLPDDRSSPEWSFLGPVMPGSS
jgi:hypothetical protein